jgi:hypothetical protein
MGKRADTAAKSEQAPKNGGGGLTAAELKLIEQIQQALSFDLLNQDMREEVSPTDHFTRGHCYVAAEAFYYLYGKEAGFEPRGRDYHWWLEHPSRGVIADPTAPQMSAGFDYSRYRSKGFMPKSPKKATEELMRRVEAIRKQRRMRWT